MKNDFDNSNWNEYQWEKEIRRDEKRINRYFHELTHCMDMPDEEDVIMKKIMAYSDLVPSKPQWDGFDPAEFNDDDDEFIFWNNARYKNGGEELAQLEKLAMEWNIIFCGQLKPELNESGMSIICLFGKLISRYVAALNTDDACALKISLLKRMMNDINELVGSLSGLSAQQTELSQSINDVINHIQSIREKIFDQLTELRD
jgi:hypothetical protein